MLWELAGDYVTQHEHACPGLADLMPLGFSSVAVLWCGKGPCSLSPVAGGTEILIEQEAFLLSGVSLQICMLRKQV